MVLNYNNVKQNLYISLAKHISSKEINASRDETQFFTWGKQRKKCR